MLSAAALRASGDATHARLGGPGSWLLALPAHHIAGMQVLAAQRPRRHRAGGDRRDATASTPRALPAAVASMSGPRRYTSLVPTQLVKALDHPDAVASLAALDAVLLGGAATPAPVLRRATRRRHHRRPYVRNERDVRRMRVRRGPPRRSPRYGSTATGRVLLGGPMLASGYRGLPDHPGVRRTRLVPHRRRRRRHRRRPRHLRQARRSHLHRRSHRRPAGGRSGSRRAPRASGNAR